MTAQKRLYLVAAGTMRSAQRWAILMGFPGLPSARNGWKYVAHIDSTYGIRDAVLVRLPSFFNHPEYAKLSDRLEVMIKLKQLQEPGNATQEIEQHQRKSLGIKGREEGGPSESKEAD